MGRYTDIAFRGLEVPVVESSVHKHQTVLGAPVVLVDLLNQGIDLRNAFLHFAQLPALGGKQLLLVLRVLRGLALRRVL